MANEEHFARLRAGVDAWNAWRKEHPDIVPDLTGANLNRAQLLRADLSKAKLRRAKLPGANLVNANLRNAYIREGDLSGADTRAADFTNADLRKADLFRTNLIEAKLCQADLRGANLRDARLERADFSGANASTAILRHVDLRWATLSEANFQAADLARADLFASNWRNATLRGADLRVANLINAVLDGSDLTGANLWETQRSGWSIKDLVCERAFWDRASEDLIEYKKGDFERIFAEKRRIVLRYPGGMSLVDFAMLPLIVERLQAEHPDCALHIRSVQDEGSGATVMITVEDITNQDSDTFRHEVDRLQSELKYIEGQRDLYRDQFMPIFRELVIRGVQTIIGQISNPAMIESLMSRDTYNIPGQAGSVGPHSHADGMTFQQNQNSLDLPKLAEELGRLRSVMKQETEGTREQDKAVAAVAEAEEAANRGDAPAMLRHLKTAGKWTLGIAEKIGVSVAADAIKKTIGPLADI